MSNPDQTEPIQRPVFDGVPKGMRRADDDGLEILDAMAGRASVFGFGASTVIDAIQATAESYLGDGSAFAGPDREGGDGSESVKLALDALLEGSSAVTADRVMVCPSADHAVESAITLARTSGRGEAYRTVAMMGSDHGRTAMCRTASGCPELHEGFGPMMAGFCHVPDGDLKALASVVDDQTACVLLSSVALGNGCRPCERDFLVGVREICDQHGILLVIDETQIAFGSSGRPLGFSSIAEIHADVVAVASGLFGGLAGGIVLFSDAVAEATAVRPVTHPLLAAVASATLIEMAAQKLPESAVDSMQQFAIALAEGVSSFEPVRDVHMLGSTIGIETDIPSEDLVRAARRHGLRLERAGETSVRIQPPLVISDEDRDALLDRLNGTIESIVRDSAEMSL